jgi:hypothetical protein
MSDRLKDEKSKRFTPTIEDFYAARSLNALGVTNEQLSNCQFLPKYSTFPFDEWPFSLDRTIPAAILTNAMPFIRPYLVYRWVTRDAPRGDAHLPAAWAELAILEADSDIQLGNRVKEINRAKSRLRRRRNYILSLNMTMHELVQQFDKNPEIQEMRYGEAWLEFYAYLDEHDLNPTDTEGSYEYNAGNEKRHVISIAQFTRYLRLARKQRRTLPG